MLARPYADPHPRSLRRLRQRARGSDRGLDVAEGVHVRHPGLRNGRHRRGRHHALQRPALPSHDARERRREDVAGAELRPRRVGAGVAKLCARLRQEREGVAGVHPDHRHAVRQPHRGEALAGVVGARRLVVAARRHVVEHDGVVRTLVEGELRHREARCEGGERRHRREHQVRLGEEVLHPLGDLGEGEVAAAEVGDDVEEHSKPYAFPCASRQAPVRIPAASRRATLGAPAATHGPPSARRPLRPAPPSARRPLRPAPPDGGEGPSPRFPVKRAPHAGRAGTRPPPTPRPRSPRPRG